VTLVDGVQGLRQISDHDEVVAQVAVADIILVSKSDLVDETDTQRLRDALASINPAGGIRSISHGEVDPDSLFAEGASRDATASDNGPGHAYNHTDAHRHGEISTCSIVHGPALDPERLRAWLRMIVSLRPHALLRIKGYAHVRGMDEPLLLQAVGPVVSPPETIDSWPDDRPETRLVLIFKGLEPASISESFRRFVVDTGS
jgi:G3E family GTPase